MSKIDWSDVKIFIVAPRELSERRFAQILKHYLPKGNIVLGISEEEYVAGFENQPQFRMLKLETVKEIIAKVAASPSPHKVTSLIYSQVDLPMIISGLKSEQRVLLVNGSWKYAFHNSESYRILQESKVSIKYISPFADEAEARDYEATHQNNVEIPARGTLLNETELLKVADTASLQSYDYSFQTGAALGKKQDSGYEFIAAAFNKVIPYQTYALHHGNSRERNLSRPHDTNHYDTIHAEMALLTGAANKEYDLTKTTLFINLLPCPNCARTLSQTNIDGIVYRHDHSDGYAADLLKMCGKKVKRVS